MGWLHTLSAWLQMRLGIAARRQYRQERNVKLQELMAALTANVSPGNTAGRDAGEPR